MIFELMKDQTPVKTCLKERVDGELLIVNSVGLNVFFLNETAKDFYQLVDGTLTLEAIVDRLAQIYEVDLAVLQKDILGLIRDMQWKDILALRG